MALMQEPKHGYCRQCGEAIQNVGAHAEACRGQAGRQRVFANYYQCKRCLATFPRGGLCWCGHHRYPVFLPVDSPGGQRILSAEGRRAK